VCEYVGACVDVGLGRQGQGGFLEPVVGEDQLGGGVGEL